MNTTKTKMKLINLAMTRKIIGNSLEMMISRTNRIEMRPNDNKLM